MKRVEGTLNHFRHSRERGNPGKSKPDTRFRGHDEYIDSNAFISIDEI